MTTQGRTPINRVQFQLVELPPPAPVSSSERFTHALVEVTRGVWNPGSGFDAAIASICGTAAVAMQAERVSIWHHDREVGLLRCLHAYCALDPHHVSGASLETLALHEDGFLSALTGVRTLEAIEVDADAGAPDSALQDYLLRHRVQAMLIAPAYFEDEMQGVIFHESIGRVRKWTQEEITFAASMGDYVTMAYEIARRRHAEAEVEHLRLHDRSTGLGNRDYMVELLCQRLAGLQGPGATMTVVHVLIDAYGGIASSPGAPTVEEVMARVALRLAPLTSNAIELARVRENGFAFLLASNATERTAVRLTERVLNVVRSLEVGQQDVAPSAAVGIAFAQGDADNDARVLMRQAEEAAEHARMGDKFSYEIFDPQQHDVLMEALRFEQELRDAFTNGEFEVHYQPEYDAHDHQWVAAESLLRWRKADRLVVAGEFIGAVESSGLMLPVGRWILHQACSDAMQWPPLPDGTFAALRVNVSARQFDEAGLVEDVTAALVASGLEPARLCLELTETTLMSDMEHALSVLQQLKTIGVQVAIDDFGTGYGSLVYLRRLPVDVLKIDRSFVEGMPGAVAETAIVKAVVGLATSLGIDVIAEGVERIAHQQALQVLGVRRMQGWLYGKAMDQESVCRLLRNPIGAMPATGATLLGATVNMPALKE